MSDQSPVPHRAADQEQQQQQQHVGETARPERIETWKRRRRMRKRLRQSEQKKLNRDSSSNHSDPSPIQNMESQSEVPKENIVNSCWLIIQKASYSRISFSSRAQPSSSPSTSSSSAHTESEGVNTSATLSCSTSFLTPDSQDKRTTFRTETSEKNTLIIDGRRSARSWTSPLSSTGPCLPTV